MTPTTVGWVLTDGHDADGATLARDEFAIQPRSDEVDAVNASEQAAAAVLRVQTMVETRGERLRGVGVTWSAEAAAEAALLVESLTGAGFDNIVPVRLCQAAESAESRTQLALPAVAESEAQLALARGAALALEPGAEFSNVVTDHQLDEAPTRDHGAGGVRSRPLSYTGALTLLVAGAVTFVVSLSIALSLHLTPTKESPPIHRVAEASGTPPIAQTVVPAAAPVAPPPEHAPEIPAEAPEAPAAPESTGEGPMTEDGVVDGPAIAPLEESTEPRE